MQALTDRENELIDALEAERQAQKHSIQALCQRVGISRATYYKWLQGTNRPTLACFLLAAEALDMVITLKGETGVTIIKTERGGV